MAPDYRGLVVMRELGGLIKELQESMNSVPGSDRLIRACTKELRYFAKLPPSRLENAASCSNLPYFRAIVKLSQAYGGRVTGMMCRFRMPRSNGAQDIPDLSFHHSEAAEKGADIPSRCEKPESVLVDLVCTQQLREATFRGYSPTGEPEPQERQKERRHQQKRQSEQQFCPGNAIDADCWAPSLWIKVVTRDALRLNAAWLGEASSSRAVCLYRQMKELATTAAWYQRGQPANWIRVVVHWMPQSSADTTAVDPGLLDALSDLNVCFLPYSRPWLDTSQSILFQQEFSKNAVSLASATLSIQKHMINLGAFHCAVSEVWTNPVDLESRCNSVSLLEAALRDALLPKSRSDETEDFGLKKQLPMLAVLDAVLHLSIKPPFSKDILNSLDGFPRVNLDVSAMIALVSELSQFLPDSSDALSDDPNRVLEALESRRRRDDLLKQPRFTCNTLCWLLESEAERAALTAIYQHIRGCVVLVCLTAALSFLRILVTVAGEHEWFRGLYLLSQVVVVPDLVLADSSSAMTNKETSKLGPSNRRKTQLIMDVGNAFGALTITANAAFLRSLRNKGLKHVALLVPARALTETAARDDE